MPKSTPIVCEQMPDQIISPETEFPQPAAGYWEPSDNLAVRCLLCPHRCLIQPGRCGICKARKNLDGQLIAWNYGKITSLALDPIEKKPLYRFHPGTSILSIGSFGCNLRCAFCQNWTISQFEAPFRLIQPDALAALAISETAAGNIGLAYTYNEPFISFEYVLDSARLIRKAGLKNVLVTNGFVNTEPLYEILPYIDAMNIDLKAWNQDFYRRICGGALEPVKSAIICSAASCHVELTTLLIPGLNDNEDEIRALAAWVASIDRHIPLHLTRHHPDYQMPDPQPISRTRMQMLAEIARKELTDVFLGNI